jgi:protein-S-isoprenylcysteine O-methyltransferase Ste14
MNSNTDRARILAPPPLLALLSIGLGFLARHLKPFPLTADRTVWEWVAGSVLAAIGIAIAASAIRSFMAHDTHPSPYVPTRAVVVSGPYSFTRNPIYLGFLSVVLAFTFFVNSLWFVVAALGLIVVLHFGVVKPEEKYLSEKFGESYRDYLRRVRRWL